MQVAVTLTYFAIAVQKWRDGEYIIYMPNPPDTHILYKKISTVPQVQNIFLPFL